MKNTISPLLYGLHTRVMNHAHVFHGGEWQSVKEKKSVFTEFLFSDNFSIEFLMLLC